MVLSPLLLYSFLQTSHWANVENNPNSKFPGFVQKYLKRGVTERGQFYQLKCDLEVYVAIYMTVTLLLGWSSLFGVFFLWQFLRMKYMINAYSQYSFRKVDQICSGYAAKLGPLGFVYGKIQQLAAYMTKMEQPGEQKGMASMCNIF